MTDAIPYSVPPEPGRWRAVTLAALVHAALFTFLWFGVRWQNETPATIEAEVWSPLPREAAPQAVPEPEPKPEIKPEPKEIQKPVAVEPPVVKPDIALEQEKKRKEKERQARDDAARLEKQKAETQRIEKEKNEAKAKREAEDAKKQTADKKLKDELDAKKLWKERAEEMRRIAGSGGSGEAAKREGISGDPGYANKIGAKIKSNTIFNVPESLAGNPSVEYAIELLPDGSVRQPIRKRKPSGVPGFDEAVLNAIEKSQPFPPDKSGKVPSTSVTIIHRPKDSNP